MADTKLLLVLVSFLTLGTILVGVTLLSYNSWNDTGKDFYQEECPRGSYYCQSPEMNRTTYVNFTESCTSADDKFLYQPEGTESGGKLWRCRSGIGWIYESKESIINLAVTHFQWLLFNNVQLQNDSYVNTYIVNNTPQDPMSINLEYVNEFDEHLHLIITSHNVVLKGGEQPYTYQTPGFYNLFSINPITITTEYNPTTGLIHSHIGNAEITTTSKISRPWIPNIFNTVHYYGGIGASDIGLNLRETNTLAISSNKADIWGSIIGFFGTIAGLVTFNTDVLCSSVNGELQCVPWFIIVLFVYIPGLAILAILVDMFMPDWL